MTFSNLKKNLILKKNNLIYELNKEPIRRILDEELTRPSTIRQLYELLYAIHDRTPIDRAKLIEFRNLSIYERPFREKEPLVSIRVPTYNKAKILSEKTIPSFLNQTYKNFEIVIVGDCCTDDTEERLKKFRDKRIHFYNFPYRGLYPQDPLNRWRVAGTLPANEALQISRGLWITPCDDDDEFLPNHIEHLLKKAQKERLELVYAKALSMDIKSGKKKVIGVFPPAHGSYSYNTALFHHGLKFFEYDLTAWTVEEPGDWNLCRRMMQAGVRMGFVDEIVTKINFINPREKIKT